MQFALLTAVFLLCVGGSYATFTNRVRDGPWYVPLMVAISVGTGVLFSVGAKVLGDKSRIFIFSLLYDVVLMVAYYVLPVVFGWCRPSPMVLVGGTLVALGILCVHLGE